MDTQIIRVGTHHDTDLITLWTNEHATHTARYYKIDALEFLSFIGKSIQEVKLYDIQAYRESLDSRVSEETGKPLSQGTKARKINSVKSLLTFAHGLGYVPFNVGKAHKAPPVHSDRAKRIMSEEQVIRLIDATRDNKRNHALLRLMYHCGLRVSEVCSITWESLTERADGGQVRVIGKGDKERYILIGKDTWNELQGLKGTSDETGYVFQSRKGHGRLDESMVTRIVQDAAKKAEIPGNVSPHWLRHAHASHSLDRGANINLVRDTLGHASLATTGKYTHARPNASSSQYLPL